MKRCLEEKLIEWKNSPDRKPLLLRGVRQCGKTYLLKKFAEKYYTDVAYFNFEENESLQSAFEGDLDPQRIIIELGVFRGKKINPGTTLIIFDEIQFCNRAITALKYFQENAGEYHLVCAGSLLGIALAKPLSFPVGKVDFLTLRPMNFYEFLIANGEKLLGEYLTELEPNAKISQLIHEKLIMYLKNYYLTGGMPEVVRVWCDTHDIEKVKTVQQKILDSYELDFAKHARSHDFPKLSAIWRSIPGQLSKENSKFVFSQVKKGWRAKDLEDALEWLISAGLVYKVYKIEKPFLPLSAYADQTFFKLYLADVGLLGRIARLPADVILDWSDTYKEFKGTLTENYVLTELMASSGETPYYWKSQNKAEVDFITQAGSEIVPLEVKSTTNDRSKSLAEYCKRYTPNYAVKASLKPLSGDDNVRNIPLYLIGRMAELL